jgi:predicted nucleic acid-binding protein
MKITCPDCKRRVNIRRREIVKCRCGNNLSYRHFFNEKINYDVYLIDSNVFIYANNEDGSRGRFCRKIIKFDSYNIKIGTSDKVINEVSNDIDNIPKTIKIFRTGAISDKLKELKTNFLKQPSEADLSLIQVAIEHPEVIGIITYDQDFDRIATSGLIEFISSRSFWLGDAKEFLEKYEIKSKIGDNDIEKY